MVAKYFAPRKLSKASLTSETGKASLTDSVHPTIVYTESEGTILLTNHTNWRTPRRVRRLNYTSVQHFIRISSSACLADKGGLRGDCLIGRASPVSMSC